MCNRIKSAKQISCAKPVYWDLIISNMNKRDVQEGCANGLYRVCTHSSNTDDENRNVYMYINFRKGFILFRGHIWLQLIL